MELEMSIKLTFSQPLKEKCIKFAADCIFTNSDKYAKRNQFNVEKIKRDIMIGKIGEELVFQHFSSHLPQLSAPDYQIYQKKDKSWSADLYDPSGIRIAVKTQNIDSEISFGRSWVFQGGMDKKHDTDTAVFKEQDDQHYVAFVSLNVPKKEGALQAVVKVEWLKQHQLFKPMQLQHLQNNKVAVYWEDLERLSDQLWQLK